jgi:hypothetical protein
MAQWLADLAQLRNSATASSDAEADASSAPADFQARYAAALRERGIDSRMVGNAVDGIFAGKPDLYRHFVKQLDAFRRHSGSPLMPGALRR